jgi:hypothetical protein
MKIFKELNEMALSNISLNQFYGIELDDFAHEVAILSLWMAEHQMNQVFFKEFGRSKPALPLTSAGNIVHGNACRLDWEIVCTKSEGGEVYLMGNPPFLGSRNQNKEQKIDQEIALNDIPKFAKLDYISSWFYKASNYINNNINQFAFVSTNSICQGEQVPILWPHILKSNLEIYFTVPSFKWTNNAKNNAGVTVVIIGVRNKSKQKKLIFFENRYKIVPEINPYLAGAPTLFIEPLTKPISNFPQMVRGNYTGCCSSLILNEQEKEQLLLSNSNSKKFIKRFVGSSEFINNEIRYCLWIPDELLDEALSIDEIKNRISEVQRERINSSDLGQQNIAYKSHQFREFNITSTNSILMPVVSSERREYIPIGFITNIQIVPNSAQVIYDCENWLFAILTSKIHNVWIKSLAGRLRSDIRYSSSLCYNTFPFPNITEYQKRDLETYVYKVLEERENFSEKTLAQLYDPDKMPDGLRNAHHQLDLAVERCFRSKPFENDEERLEYLFKLYEKMIEEDKSRGTLFEMESKPQKKKK